MRMGERESEAQKYILNHESAAFLTENETPNQKTQAGSMIIMSYLCSRLIRTLYRRPKHGDFLMDFRKYKILFFFGIF